jgi:hypothetical protein
MEHTLPQNCEMPLGIAVDKNDDYRVLVNYLVLPTLLLLQILSVTVNG